MFFIVVVYLLIPLTEATTGGQTYNANILILEQNIRAAKSN